MSSEKSFSKSKKSTVFVVYNGESDHKNIATGQEERIHNLQSENQHLKNVIKPLLHLKHVLLFWKHKFQFVAQQGGIQNDIDLCLKNYYEEIVPTECLEFVLKLERFYGSNLEYRDYHSVSNLFGEDHLGGVSNLHTENTIPVNTDLDAPAENSLPQLKHEEAQNKLSNQKRKLTDYFPTEVPCIELTSDEEDERIFRKNLRSSTLQSTILTQNTQDDSSMEAIEESGAIDESPGYSPQDQSTTAPRPFRATRLKYDFGKRRAYICQFDQCEQAFTTREQLKMHNENEHYANGYCQACQKDFKQLWMHFYNMHQRGSYSCPVEGCHFQAQFRNIILNHRNTVHRNQTGHNDSLNLSCPHEGCQLILHSQGGLKRHLAEAHLKSKSSSRFLFSGSREFVETADLLNHTRSEANLKRYRCKWPTCFHICTSRSNMKKHIRVTHLKVPATKIQQREMNIPDEIFQMADQFLEVLPEDAEL